VVSGQAEAEFDLGMKVNLDATRTLLELCRTLTTPPKVVFTSSIAVFGGTLPDVLADHQALTPQNSYGAQKAMGELMVSDMSRKGFIDGRALRLPTITVRPGKPNKAASSFASGMIREPMAGAMANVPVKPETVMWVQSPEKVIENLIIGHEIPAAQFSPATRAFSVPGISVSIGEMAAALRRVAGDAIADRLTWNDDPTIDAIVRTWPKAFEAKFGRAAGMVVDADFDAIVQAHRAAQLLA
jgi:D-erythronate 2-dehydrogenase